MLNKRKRLLFRMIRNVSPHTCENVPPAFAAAAGPGEVHCGTPSWPHVWILGKMGGASGKHGKDVGGDQCRYGSGDQIQDRLEPLTAPPVAGCGTGQ